ncbi:hypothetical protein VOLCADRAFT_96931 [Volvox carteri f. nagariensis]|uniref:Uncharacterized protein n=1 Tax=Volvox carteri f. nagariensis TaxID=3068 RepID=D8UBD1_VOLCA|nr:uncharacterized protein VOLCADRAFT_96931 [Volvox carteri f. nagariensis]EFJ42982.1 hypothetical protein VOLCADRAFT_96931 [Volvox carteri f. nagariensis]|eukprot:XP_002956022.1 hypothetical protein VOLCADRAFT_96931 [Volvox carteri f. nagariensis]
MPGILGIGRSAAMLGMHPRNTSKAAAASGAGRLAFISLCIITTPAPDACSLLLEQSVTAQTLHSGATSTRQTTREGKVQELTGDGQNGKIINNYLLGSDDSIMAGLSVNNNNEALQHAGQQIRVSLLPLSKNDSKSSDGNNNAVLEDATADDSKQVSSKTYGSQMPYTAVARKLAQVSTTANNPKQDASSKDVSVTDRQPVTNLTSVIFLLNYCGLKNLYNASTFRKIWLNDPGTPANAFTMQNYVSYCSQGMAQMPSASQLIFNVELPCNGVWYHPFMRNRPFDLSKNCGTTEKLYMFNKATEIVENASRISISSIRQRIAILPQNNPCSSTWGDWKILGNEPKSTYYPSFPVPAIYISFRSKYEPFENLTTEDDNSVNIYTYKGDRSLVDSFWRTQHVKALKAGGLTEYRDDGWSGVVVRLVRVMPGDSAVVVVCRSSGPTESQGGNTCSDGLDNDCDGLVDAEQDGDCNASTTPSQPTLSDATSTATTCAAACKADVAKASSKATTTFTRSPKIPATTSKYCFLSTATTGSTIPIPAAAVTAAAVAAPTTTPAAAASTPRAP